MTDVTTVPISLLPAGTYCLSHPAWKGGSFRLHLTEAQGIAPSAEARIPMHSTGHGRAARTGSSLESCQPEAEAEALSLTSATPLAWERWGDGTVCLCLSQHPPSALTGSAGPHRKLEPALAVQAQHSAHLLASGREQGTPRRMGW